MISSALQKLSLSIANLSIRQAVVVAILSGAANVLAFAPFFLWPIQIISLTLIFALLIQHPHWNKKQVAVIGLSYAFAWLFIGISWLLIALSRYGGLPIALSVIGLSLFVLYLAIYSAFALLLSHLIITRWQLSKSISLLLLMPTMWAFFELLRGYVMTGFPWLSSGYAHNTSFLAGFAPIVGVYGLGLLSAIIAGALTLFIVDQTVQSRIKACAVLIVLLFAGVGLQSVSWTKSQGQTISVRLIQGNIDQGIKFDTNFVQHSLNLYDKLITEQAADLIVTPETALPVISTQLPPDYLEKLHQFATQNQSHLMLGLVMKDDHHRYANSIVGFAPDQTITNYRYDKHHLVPFGEFVPLGFRWFVDMLRIPLGEFSTKGLLQEPMRIKDQLIMPNICYEDLFGDEIAKQLRSQIHSQQGVASILLNSSNLAWYGDSIAIPQHLQISQMRSLETGRPMLRSTNTGATAIINEKGEVVTQLKPLSQNTLSANVQGMQGLTPYIQYGDLSVLVLIALGLLIVLINVKNRKT